jgi:adenylosuccinate synthase
MNLKRERFGQVIAVMGMQFGSEGKGAIAEYLSYAASIAVRTGAANAGHTIYYKGEKFVMRQLPVAWTNPTAKLVIGMGAMISLDVLLQELETIDKVIPIKGRVFIDKRVHVITQNQIDREQGTDLAARIGSTSAKSREGIGMAAADKVLRSKECRRAEKVPILQPYVVDTVGMVNTALEQDEIVLLEGTQGFGLSVDHGHFPFTTSRDTSVTATAASVGICTHEFPIDVIGVVRTYPIRVAGNSGPFGKDAQELTWEEVNKRAGAPPGTIIERTTVTNGVRRVSEFSEEEFAKACQVDRPTQLAVTFVDYLDWRMHESQNITHFAHVFLEKLERMARCPVTLVKTGPHTTIDFDNHRAAMWRKLAA